MITTPIKGFRTAIAMIWAVIALSLMSLAITVPDALASESNYCYGQALPGNGRCVGASREFNALYGQGAQHSVCVWASNAGGEAVYGSITCSAGAGQGTYNSSMFLASWSPVISNNAAGSNTVYGIAFRP